MTGHDAYAPQSGDPTFDVASYELDITYRVRTNRLEGRATLNAIAAARIRFVTLDLIGLRATRVRVDGEPRTEFSQGSRKLRVLLPQPLEPGAAFSIEIAYAGSPAPRRSRWGTIGWEELEDGALVAGQPIGAPTWFPCNDRPDDRARYRIAVTADAGYAIAATGVPGTMTRSGGRVRREFVSVAPMATYLAAVHIGRYREDPLGPATVVCPPGLSVSVQRAFADVPRIMTCFEQAFGPYPQGWCTIVVTADALEIPLEAQGLVVFGSNHLDAESARLIPHELAHQWFGNSVGLARWRDIWLNEGFACYAEWVWSEASGGPSIAELAAFHHDRLGRLPQDLVLSDPGPDRMFDDRVYKRGALLLVALRTRIGDAAFSDVLRHWVAAHRHELATTDDFRLCVERVTGDSHERLLNDWLVRAPLPPLR